ncbi:MAG: ABC transporter permease [Hyphomicrobiales bacterium]|nr:ABC transporter permease [Hyphomicrobiales bacterium]
MQARQGRLPVHWLLLDRIEQLAAFVWPSRLKRSLGWLFLLPAVALVGLLAIGLGYMIEYSLHELDLSTYRLKEAYSLENYAAFIERPVYFRILVRTLLAATIVTAITLFLAFPYAYVLVRTPSALVRKVLLVALFLPFFIGQVVRAYGWLIVLGKEGLINSLLGSLGLPSLNLLFNYPAVIFGLVQYMLPFAVLLIIPAMAAISEDVERASEGLGARWLSTFRHVVLPMARPGLIGASVVVFTLTLTDFAMPEILGGGTSDFIASAIYDSFFQISNPGLGAALSMILVTVGSIIVAAIFYVAGTGTLGIRGEAR